MRSSMCTWCRSRRTRGASERDDGLFVRARLNAWILLYRSLLLTAVIGVVALCDPDDVMIV